MANLVLDSSRQWKYNNLVYYKDGDIILRGEDWAAFEASHKSFLYRVRLQPLLRASRDLKDVFEVGTVEGAVLEDGISVLTLTGVDNATLLHVLILSLRSDDEQEMVRYRSRTSRRCAIWHACNRLEMSEVRLQIEYLILRLGWLCAIHNMIDSYDRAGLAKVTTAELAKLYAGAHLHSRYIFRSDLEDALIERSLKDVPKEELAKLDSVTLANFVRASKQSHSVANANNADRKVRDRPGREEGGKETKDAGLGVASCYTFRPAYFSARHTGS